MKFGKIILAVLVISFLFSFAGIYAQNPKSSEKISLSKGKSLLFKENETIITEVEFTGLDSDYNDAFEMSVYESDFLKLLGESRAMISADDKYNSRKIERLIKLLKEWLANKGYLKAEVVALGERLLRDRMKLVFSVERGNKIAVSEINFVGNISVAGEELTESMKQCLEDLWINFDRRHYDYCARKGTYGLMLSKGYFQAKIEQISPRLVADNYVVTIKVKEGIRYRIGEIKVEGAKIFTEKELLEMSELKTGDVANGEALQDFVYEKLKKIYWDKGYVLFDSEFDAKFVEPQAKGLDGIVNLQITIDEGLPVKLGSINFSGVEKKKAGELRELFSLKDGEIYNQSKIEDGVKKINETKKFYSVDKDQDVEIKRDEESNDIYIVVRVKEVN